jgi:predicted ribosome quality control (RQC) complex YloA/Tae2 family protein
VSLRLANVYDLNSKILLLKFARPDNKKQLLIESGFRCHLTEFARTTAAAPSAFVARLRKFLKTRRVTSVSQIGTDRIIEFRFSDGQYRLYLEFFASGNVILTDSDLKILTLMRNVNEGEGQEPQRVGQIYNLENRQNYGGIPPLTKERLRDALKTTVEKAGRPQPTGKKGKKKPGEELRRGLATTITELPPMLVEHAFKVTDFDPTSNPSEILENDGLFDSLFHSLETARSIVEEVTSSATSKGYIIAKRRSGTAAAQQENEGAAEDKHKDLLYEDFHPFLPKQFENPSPDYKVLTFDGFNKTVDEFFSSLEGQRLESRLTEREAAAKRKLDAAEQDQAKRLEGLHEAQVLNERKAAAIEANVERIQEAMDAVNGLLQQGMDWVDINKLVEREQRMGNPVAQLIKLPMNLAENIITLTVSEEEEADDEGTFDYETDSDVSDDEYAATDNGKSKQPDKRLEVDIKLGLSPWANATEYYEQKRTAAVKHEKTLQQSTMALKNAEHKIAKDLKKGLKQEKAILQPVRRQMWFEKFTWFLSSDGYLVLGGRDAQQNEILYKRYLRKGDVYVHADLHGASSVIVKNNPKTPDAPIPPSTLSQAGTMSVCSSSAWDSKAGMSAWWVRAEQVSKSAPTGQFLPAGSFMVRGEKNFLPPAPLILGFALMFKLSEESKAKHVKHRIYNDEETTRPERAVKDAPEAESAEIGQEEDDDDSGSGTEDEDESQQRSNPLQSIEANDSTEQQEDDQEPQQEPEPPTEKLADLDLADNEQAIDTNEPDEQDDDPEDHSTPQKTTHSRSETPSTSSNPQKKTPAKRGQRGKAKKLAAKYKYEDEEDRALREALTGAAVARRRAEEEAAAKARRAADAAAAAERKRLAEERRVRAAAEHEEVRRVMLDEGVDLLDDSEADQVALVDGLVGTPLPGDEILEVVPVCAPWSALARCKYKAKLQPGTVKKGKAVKEVVERWRTAAGKKGVVDETGHDLERMWPREVELIKGLKTEEAYNCVPVSKVRVMLAGGSGGGGGSGKGKGGGGNSGGGQGNKKQRGQKKK